MRKAIAWVLVIIVTFGLGVVAGRFLQPLRNGYFYEVRREQTIHSEVGPISVKYVTESVGMTLLDAGTSILTLDDAPCGPITIYKAKRAFQEPCPVVWDVTVHEGEIQWQDGTYDYRLRVEPIISDEATATASGDASR